MIPATKREYLRQLVDGKNRWSRQLTVEEKALGFLGWHERGYLPHCDFPGLVQFVTVRLVDSLPASCRGEWEHLLAIEDVRERRTQLEAYLDQGAGDCQLRDPHFAGLAEEALLHRHMQTHELLAWCVMPNHVHVLVHVWQTPLWKLIKSWKVHAALGARRLPPERRIPIRRDDTTSTPAPNWSSALRWQREYWDTFMRDEHQERTAICYIESNPVKARLCRAPEGWAFCSARFRDANRRLSISTGAPTSNSAR